MNQSISHFWKENKSFVLFIFLMFVFRSVVADWNTVPTGSMKPTIMEGDRILVNRMAYDLRLSFTHVSMVKLADPERGDIIIFDSEQSDKRLVKRVIGIPGDIVSMLNNTLSINDHILPYTINSQTAQFSDITEDLLGLKHSVRFQHSSNNKFSSFAPVKIPDNFYLALGDNRDKSADSRFIGLIPRNEIVGRSSNVVLSLNYDNYYLPRQDRFFKAL
ncbi:MAG: signal peptidase I [Gammaproteobacteria bacterium]|nr:signal peptidase I [Gammaproteobacteria bacterium]